MLFAYKVFFASQSKKELSKIKKGNPKSARKIIQAINELSHNPQRGPMLHGDMKGRRKWRVGDYRIIYQVEKREIIIYILRVAHRKDVYR